MRRYRGTHRGGNIRHTAETRLKYAVQQAQSLPAWIPAIAFPLLDSAAVTALVGLHLRCYCSSCEILFRFFHAASGPAAG